MPTVVFTDLAKGKARLEISCDKFELKRPATRGGGGCNIFSYQ